MGGVLKNLDLDDGMTDIPSGIFEFLEVLKTLSLVRSRNLLNILDSLPSSLHTITLVGRSDFVAGLLHEPGQVVQDIAPFLNTPALARLKRLNLNRYSRDEILEEAGGEVL